MDLMHFAINYAPRMIKWRRSEHLNNRGKFCRIAREMLERSTKTRIDRDFASHQKAGVLFAQSQPFYSGHSKQSLLPAIEATSGHGLTMMGE